MLQNDMDIISLFPKAVAIFKRNNCLSIEELSAINYYSKDIRCNQFNTTSINSNILEIAALQNIKGFILTSIQEYFDKVICPDGNVIPFITMSWLNFTEKNGSHHRHVHSNSIISGVFYINAKKENDKIVFYKPGYNMIDLTSSNLHPLNAPSWWIPVNSNELVLFPSELEHSVPTFTEDYTRISIAFNVFIKGSFGNKEDLKWVEL